LPPPERAWEIRDLPEASAATPTWDEWEDVGRATPDTVPAALVRPDDAP